LHLAEFIRSNNGSRFRIPCCYNITSVKLSKQSINSELTITTLRVLCPVIHQDIFNLIVVLHQFNLYLLSPYDWSYLHWDISCIANLGVLSIHVVLKVFFVQLVYAFFHCFKQLNLIFLNCRFNPRPKKQIFEFEKNTKHFMGIWWSS
jgi:hypothetical protein